MSSRPQHPSLGRVTPVAPKSAPGSSSGPADRSQIEVPGNPPGEDSSRGNATMSINRSFVIYCAAIVLSISMLGPSASAQKKYDEGATDGEIKIGHTNPYSGNASAYGTIGKAIDAFFKMVNDKGGINGRKITFISYDDGYSPPRTVEMVRKLVEEDKVLFVFNTLGTPPNTAIQKYLNQKKVPQLFVATGASKWGHFKDNPWTMGFQPDYVTEANIYARHIIENVKDPKIAVLMQNDDYGKDYFEGFKQGLGKDADKLIVAHATYE